MDAAWKCWEGYALSQRMASSRWLEDMGTQKTRESPLPQGGTTLWLDFYSMHTLAEPTSLLSFSGCPILHPRLFLKGSPENPPLINHLR